MRASCGQPRQSENVQELHDEGQLQFTDQVNLQIFELENHKKERKKQNKREATSEVYIVTTYLPIYASPSTGRASGPTSQDPSDQAYLTQLNESLKERYDDRRLVNRGSSDRITISPQLSFFPASSPLEVWGANLPDSGIELHVGAL